MRPLSRPRFDALIDNPAKLAAARGLYRDRAQAFDFDDSVETLVELYRSVIDESALRRETA